MSDIVEGVSQLFFFFFFLHLFRSTLRGTKFDVSILSVMHQQTLTAALFTW